MASTRLPGKVLLDIEGKIMLQRIVERISRSEFINKIIVATTLENKDDEIEKFVTQNLNCEIFRGSENDVLDRFYKCAKKYHADLVIRVTADDPLKDPHIIDKAVEIMIKNSNLDYCSNTIQPTYPEGLDIEVIRFSSLERAFYKAIISSEREHVTPYIWKNKHKFNVHNFKFERDLSSWRWTIDKKVDLDFICCIFKEFKDNPFVTFEEVIKFIENNPEIMLINNEIVRNEGYIKSLKED